MDEEEITPDADLTEADWYRWQRDNITDVSAALIMSGEAKPSCMRAKTREDAKIILIEIAAEFVAAIDRKGGIKVPKLTVTKGYSDAELESKFGPRAVAPQGKTIVHGR